MVESVAAQCSLPTTPNPEEYEKRRSDTNVKIIQGTGPAGFQTVFELVRGKKSWGCEEGKENLLKDKKRICFVCLGNIVRSPLAEHLFNHLTEQMQMADRYEASSAGLGSWHIGERPDPRMLQVAARNGLVYDGKACQFERSGFDDCDLILAMDRDNRSILRRMASNEEQRQKIHLLREFDPEGDPNASVPDPWYGGAEGFEEVYRIIERSVRGLVKALEEGEVWEA